MQFDITFSTGAYAKTPSLVRVTRINGTGASVNMTFSAFGVSGDYVFDGNNQVYIDLSDFVAAMTTGETQTFIITYGTQITSVPIQRVGLLAPADVFIPHFSQLWLNELFVANGLYTCLPSRWIISPAAITPYEMVEVYVRNSSSMQLDKYGSIIDLQPGLNNVSYNGADLYVAIVNKNEDVFVKIQRQQANCNREYAVVEWTSRFGGKKCHVWEVVNIAEAVSDSTSLMTIDDTFNVHKGSRATFALKLDNLNQFDYWYYADIITSDDVRVWLCSEDSAPASFDDVQRVDITTNSYTLPAYGSKGTLQVGVTWKKYKEL